MEKFLPIPIGVDNFKEIIDKTMFYIDKTLFIKEFWHDGSKIILAPRPRRFGKTLNLSMMKYFFERTTESNAYLFEKTNIWQDLACRKEQGQYPVIFITLKDVKDKTWDQAYLKMISLLVEELIRVIDPIVDALSVIDQNTYRMLINKTADNVTYKNSLLFATKVLEKHYGKKVVVLIDEYDAPLITSYLNNYYDHMVDFMRDLLSAALKTNVYLEKAFLTGITRTAKEGIFSGLNHFNVCTVLDEKFSDKFGFTQEEVDHVLASYDLTEHQASIKTWYNGYLFGNTTIYNPWSMLKCVDQRGSLQPYWVNTSDNALIKKLIAQADRSVKIKLESLIKRQDIIEVISDAFVFLGIEKNENAVWSLLLFAGYITSKKTELIEGRRHCSLIIPNAEIHLLYRELVQEIFKENLSTEKISVLLKSLTSGDIELFEELLQEFIQKSMSYYDFHHDEPEKSYHLFVLGLLVMLSDQYEITSNQESGYGRYDIFVIPKDTQKLSLIIEFKKVREKNETLEIAADKALEQIKARNYAASLHVRNISNILSLGIGFEGKKVLVKSIKA